jgi:hypothetical protein
MLPEKDYSVMQWIEAFINLAAFVGFVGLASINHDRKDSDIKA